MFLLLILLFVSGVSLPSAFAAATEPYGLAAMQQFDRLPYLKLDTMGGQQSSYDRTGGNSDGFGASNYLYIDSYGDKVMLDLKGPGAIYCLWFTGFDWNTANLKIYFDGGDHAASEYVVEGNLGGEKRAVFGAFGGDR